MLCLIVVREVQHQILFLTRRDISYRKRLGTLLAVNADTDIGLFHSLCAIRKEVFLLLFKILGIFRTFVGIIALTAKNAERITITPRRLVNIYREVCTTIAITEIIGELYIILCILIFIGAYFTPFETGLNLESPIRVEISTCRGFHVMSEVSIYTFLT